MKKSELKILIKEILKETVNRMGTIGLFVEPNGTIHDVENDSHYEWAYQYMMNQEKRFSDNPIDELIGRGWMRVIISPVESLIMVMTGNRRNEYLTRAQREFLEDKAEETNWAVKDDDGYIIYKPYRCDTPEEFLQEGKYSDINRISNNQVYNGKTSFGGYGHGSVSDGNTQMVRDPLNDPKLTGKVNEAYRFKDYSWLKNSSGFNIPTDVYHDTVLLGVIESRPEGYLIVMVDTPNGSRGVNPSKNNNFKTKDLAAKALHTLWKQQRTT